MKARVESVEIKIGGITRAKELELVGGLAPDEVGGLAPDVEDVEDVEEAEYVEDVEVGGLAPDEDKDFHRKWHDMLIRQTPIKVYESINSNSMYYVGATINIKAIYKSIARCKSSNTSLAPAYCDAPVFSSRKSVYGLAVNYDENTFQIVNSDTIMSMILHGDINEC